MPRPSLLLLLCALLVTGCSTRQAPAAAVPPVAPGQTGPAAGQPSGCGLPVVPVTAVKPPAPVGGLSGKDAVASGTAVISPSMSGTIAAIKNNCLRLDNPEYSLPTRPAPRLALPAGRWLDDHHWQSDAKDIDLFAGQKVTYFLDTHTLMPELQFVHGVVLRAEGGVLSLDTYQDGGSDPARWHVRQEPVNLQLAPYSLRGQGKDAQPEPGDQVLAGWFGVPGEQIVWQSAWVGHTAAVAAPFVDPSVPQGMATFLIARTTENLQHLTSAQTPERQRLLLFTLDAVRLLGYQNGVPLVRVTCSLLPASAESDHRAGDGVPAPDGWIHDKGKPVLVVPDGDSWRLESGLP